MTDLIALLAIGLGALAILVGLALIAPQVREHRIEVYSAGSWVFRGGALLAAVGLIIMIVAGGPFVLSTVGLVAGTATLLGGLFVLNHEREQALDHGPEQWDWPRSLTTQMMASGLLLLVLAVLA